MNWTVHRRIRRGKTYQYVARIKSKNLPAIYMYNLLTVSVFNTVDFFTFLSNNVAGVY